MLNSFHEEIVKITEANYETRLALESQKEETHIQKIQDAINEIEDNILSGDYQQRISSTAAKGYRKCVLFEFDGTSKKHEFPLTFLFYGPKKDRGHGSGLEFFEKIDVECIMKKLSVELAPFKLHLACKHWGNRKRIHSLIVSW